MEARILGRTGREVSVVGLGTWQLGADWGEVSEDDALAVLAAAVESGVTFLDTADVYGDGRSEQLIGQFLRGQPGRRASRWPPRWAAGWRRTRRCTRWTTSAPGPTGPGPTWASTRSTWSSCTARRPPVYADDAVFDALDTLVAEQRIAAYGVSVETCAEALTAIARPGVASVQIILNAFRRKPLERGAARRRGGRGRHHRPGPAGRPACCPAGTTRHHVRRPTTTAPTTGTARRSTSGETFSGVDYDTGVAAAARVRRRWPRPGATTAQAALRWIIQQPGVTTVIPGARNAEQARQNAAAAALPPLPDATLTAIEDVYNSRIRPLVHDRW